MKAAFAKSSILFALAAAAAVPSASASPIEVSASASTRVTFPDLQSNPTAANDYQSFDNTTPSTAATPTSISSKVPPQGGASAAANVTASAGVFHGYATATHPETGDAYYAEATVSIYAQDSLTLAPLLPVGTPVVVNYSLAVSGSATQAACGTGCGGSFSAAAEAGYSISAVTGTGSLNLFFNSAATNNVLSGAIAGRAGDVFVLVQTLNLQTYVNGIQYLGAHPDTATADYSNTVHFYADTPTPGATLVAGSGHVYASPSAVPLPAAWTLVLPAFAMLGRRRLVRIPRCG